MSYGDDAVKYFGAGNEYFDRKDWTNAIDSFTKACAICEALGAEENVAMCKVKIGLANEQLNKLTDAVNNYDAARQLYLKLGKTEEANKMGEFISNVYFNFSIDLVKANRYDDANNILSMAIEFYKAIGNYASVDKCNNVLALSNACAGSDALKAENYAKAVEYLTRARDLYDNIGDDGREKSCIKLLSSAYLNLAKTSPDGAKGYLLKARECMVAAGDREQLAMLDELLRSLN